jgi:carbon monoxide dehydrogenase subunit G
MELTSQQALPVSQSQAWEALNDTAMLQAAIPGCESITPGAEPNHYEVAIMAAIGPVKARFKGKLRLEDLQPPTSYTLYFEGQGGQAGHGKGQAAVRLEPNGPGETVLHYTATASVGGKIAQIGSRLVDMAAQKMATDFFSNFTAALVEKYGPTPAPVPAVAEARREPDGPIARLMAWLKRLLA